MKSVTTSTTTTTTSKLVARLPVLSVVVFLWICCNCDRGVLVPSIVSLVDAFSVQPSSSSTATRVSLLRAMKLPFLSSSLDNKSNNNISSTTPPLPKKPTSAVLMIPTKSKLTPIQRLRVQQQQLNDDDENNNNNKMKGSTFDQLKHIFYAIRDPPTPVPPTATATTTSVLSQMLDSMSFKKNKGASSSSSSSKSKIYDGFNSKVVTPPPITRTPSFLQMISSFPTTKLTPIITTTSEPVTTTTPLTQSPTLFDTVKGALYNTADFIAQSSSSNNNYDNNKSINKQKSTIVVSSKSNTSSSNQKKTNGGMTFEQIKIGFYTVSDVITNTIQTVPTIPKKIEQTSQTTKTFLTRTIPNQAQATVSTVTAIPQTIQQTIINCQMKIDDTMTQTDRFVQSIRSIPNQFQETIQQQQQQSIDTVQESIQDMTTSMQVRLGLRTPIIQPPKQLPTLNKSTSSSRQMMMDATYDATRSAGAILTKSLIWFGTSSMDRFTTIMAEQQEKTKTAKVVSSATTTAGLNHDIDIVATLQLAEEAMVLAESITATTTSRPFDNDDDLDIMATLQLANDAIALAESVVTVETVTSPLLTTSTSTAATTITSTINNDDDKNGADDLDIMATLQLANDAIALAESVVTVEPIPSPLSATTSTTSAMDYDDDDLDIMATLQLANDAIALAESVEPILSPLSTTTTTTSAMDSDDDDLDIMATVQLANDAIALAGSVVTVETTTTAAVSQIDTVKAVVAATTISPPSSFTTSKDSNDNDELDVMAILQLANDAIALAESVVTVETTTDQSDHNQ